MVLQWRGVSLQLPRTNNAGPPSYTDGRWWWSPVDPDRPEFLQRRGAVENYGCEPAGRADALSPGMPVAEGPLPGADGQGLAQAAFHERLGLPHG